MQRDRAVPRYSFSWDFRIYLGGKLVTTLDMARLRESGHFTLEGTRYKVSRGGFLGGDFLLVQAGRMLASATKASAFRRRFIVHLDSRVLTLEAASAFNRRFRLIERGVVVGGVRPNHIFTRKCSIAFPDNIPAPVKVFLFWLVVLMWHRAAGRAAASGS